MDWPQNLWYVKYDIKQAFFNIPVHKKSQYVTNFAVNGSTYKFKYLPFGISVAPFVCQQFLNAIMRFIRQTAKWTWGHLDDFLIGHESKEVLRKLVRKLEKKLKLARWPINYEKSVRKPTRRLEFLGATWDGQGVTRNERVTAQCKLLIELIPTIRTEKKEQIVRGYLNYYMAFAEKCFSFINRALAERTAKYVPCLLELLKFKTLKFYPRTMDRTPDVTIYTDATTCGLGIVGRYPDGSGVNAAIRTRPLPIITAETVAALLGLKHFALFNRGHSNFLLYTDNTATLYFLRKGSCKFFLPFEAHFIFCKFLAEFSGRFKLNVRWIPSESNPSDDFSRHPDGMAGIYRVGSNGVSDVVTSMSGIELRFMQALRSLQGGPEDYGLFNI